MPDAPCVERGVERRFKVSIGPVLSFEKCFHQFPRLLCPTEHGKIPPRLRVRSAVGCNLAIVLHSQKQILLGPCSYFRKEHPCQVGWTKNLFERGLHYRNKRVMYEPPQRNICRRPGEPFGAGQFDRRHSQSLDISGVTNRTHRNPIVDLKNLLARLTYSEKQNAISIAERCDRTARSKLRFDVLAPVGDGFNPTVRFFNHATLSLNTAAILFSGKVVMPSRDTILIRG